MNLLLTIVLLILFVSCENSEILPEKENYSANKLKMLKHNRRYFS
jgi:hypothetical protein